MNTPKGDTVVQWILLAVIVALALTVGDDLGRLWGAGNAPRL